MKTKLTAASFRWILLASLFLTALIGTGGFYYAQSSLREYAYDISQLNADAQAGDTDVRTLLNLDERLQKDNEIVSKTHSIVSDSKQYVYQDQIVKDISSIAQKSGVSVRGFDFKKSTPATAPTAPAAPATTPTAPLGAAPVVGSGVKSIFADVSVSETVRYTNLIKFIKAIEQNPTKMQLSKVALTRDEATNGNVKAETFTIEVYVR